MVTNYKILMLFALFLICSKVHASKSNNYTKIWGPTSNSDFEKYGTSMEQFTLFTSDNSFLYAVCSLNNQSPCNIKIITPIEENSLKENTCNLQLSDNIDTFTRIFNLQRFNNNKVIVTWGEQKINSRIEITITALDISSCNASQYIKYTVFRADENTMLIDPLILNDTIDIFVGIKRACQPFERCKITFDHNNRLIGSPELFPIFLKQGYPHEVGPVGNTSVFIRGYGDPSTIKVLYARKNYSETIELMAEYVSEGAFQAFINSAVSNAHDLYTICWEDRMFGKWFARCMQFDYLGRKRFNVTVPFEESAGKMARVYNLANGDILFFTKQDSMIEVRKIDADGQVGRPLGLDFSCRSHLAFFQMYAVETNDDLDIYLACATEELKLSFRNVQKKYLNKRSSG